MDLSNRKCREVSFHYTHATKGKQTKLKIVDVHGLNLTKDEFPEDNVIYFYEIWLPIIREQITLPESLGGDHDYYSALLKDAIYFNEKLIKYAIFTIVEYVQDSIIEEEKYEAYDFIRMSTNFIELFNTINICKYGSLEKYNENMSNKSFINFISSTHNQIKNESTTKIKEYVYLMHTEHSVKIGRTLRPEQRKKEISIKLPFPVIKFEYFEVADYIKTEKHFHDLFSSKRMNGEWFSLTSKDIYLFKKEIKNHM